MKLKILLTGGNGFIGKNLVEQLNSKYTFLTPTHQELELANTSEVDKFFTKHRVDMVLHAANRGGTVKTAGDTDVVETNLRIFINLIKNQHRFGRLIYFGSGAEYGKQRHLKKISETNFGQIIPIDAYGFYKYCCSLIAASYPQITNLRLFGVFGKYEDYEQRFISQAILQALHNKPITIKQNVYFDYLYINDLVKIVDYFINHSAKYQFYNVGRGQSLSLLAIAKKILTVSQKNLPIKIQNPGLNHEYTCNITRLKNEISHLQFTPMAQTLKELIAHYS